MTDIVFTHAEAFKTAMVFASVWFALFLYIWTLVRLALEKRASPRPRFLWSTGCMMFLIHVAGAFEVFHGWSHTDAYEKTALDSMALTGVRAGWGLYFNYAFTLIWLADMIWWWVAGDERYRRRNKPATAAFHIFFLFMMFNGAFFFVDGWVRWMGLVLTIAGAALVIKFLVREPARAPYSAT